ncbi:hypothetical protein C8A01DRAFT_21307, partial [Parachaetomium inaequale]
DPLLSTYKQELQAEEQRLDEQIAIARREAEIHRKKAKLEQLQRQTIVVLATPPLANPYVNDQPVQEPCIIPIKLVAPAIVITSTILYHTIASYPSYSSKDSTALRNFLYNCKANFQLIGEIR